jgi:hypothetical protein
MPRGRQSIGNYVDALDKLLVANPGEASFTERAHWL